MRSEEEMFALILNTARNDERIRAVILNGSRANPNAKRDLLQDFDIIYLVSEMGSFLADPGWVDCFGERIIMQLPDEMDDPDCPSRQHFAYLMQLADGSRIDLTLVTRGYYFSRPFDSLSVLLLDKDGEIPAFPPASESDYLPQPPTEREFFNCCNEFWWVSPYVAKGLCRRELPYAKHMLDEAVRAQLDKMLIWHIGLKGNFKVNPGKAGKYFEQTLEPELWQMLKKTYSGADYEETWQALFAICALFQKVAQPLAIKFNYTYLLQEDERVNEYIRSLQQRSV